MAAPVCVCVCVCVCVIVCVCVCVCVCVSNIGMLIVGYHPKQELTEKVTLTQHVPISNSQSKERKRSTEAHPLCLEMRNK